MKRTAAANMGFSFPPESPLAPYLYVVPGCFVPCLEIVRDSGLALSPGVRLFIK